MNQNHKKILFVDESLNPSQINKYLNDESIIKIVVDYISFQKLSKLKLNFLFLDDFLNKVQRTELYESAIKLLDWSNLISNKNNFQINNVNILKFFPPLELHEFLLDKMIKFFSIKNTLDSLHPDKIIISEYMVNFVPTTFRKNSIQIIQSDINSSQKGIIHNQIELRFNILSKPLTFYLSKNWFLKLKNIIDDTFSLFYNLKLKNFQNEIILLLEINPSVYGELISNISNSNKTVVLLNRRRPVLLDSSSRKLLKSSNVKILNPEDFFDSKAKKEFITKRTIMTKSFEKLWNDSKLVDIFSCNNVSFWSSIKESLLKIYSLRLDDYLKLYFISNNVLESLNIKSILQLNESGETENIFLQNNQNKIKTFLLQHSFLRYQKTIYDIQWPFEDQYIHGLKSSIFLLWGPADHEFFSKYSNIDSKKLIISGSPRHDSLKLSYKKIKNNTKSVLITLTPLSIRSGNQTISLIHQYEKILEKIISYLQTAQDVNIIIKLHPGENLHNSILLNFLKKFDNITLYQTKNPYELIDKSKFVITITPELYDSSTIMLDALTLEKPVVQFILGLNNDYSSNLEDPISVNSYQVEIKEVLSNYFNDNFYSSLIQKIPQKLKQYISYYGDSCERTSRIITE
tara:strand:+ start:2572 stop:4461 length:1890 start_codon:yes stop_codon:yes gene_type:complete